VTKRANDWLEITSDVVEEIGPVKALKKIWDKFVEKRIDSLFRTAAKQLDGEGTLEEKFREKLLKYTENEDGQETVYLILNKALIAESAWCCRIIGVLLGRAMNQDRKLTVRERTITDALKVMIDDELSLLVNLNLRYRQLPVPSELLDAAKGDLQKASQEWSKCSLHIRDYYEVGLLAGNIEDDISCLEHMKRLRLFETNIMYRSKAMNNTTGMFRFSDLVSEVFDIAMQVKE